MANTTETDNSRWVQFQEAHDAKLNAQDQNNKEKHSPENMQSFASDMQAILDECFDPGDKTHAVAPNE